MSFNIAASVIRFERKEAMTWLDEFIETESARVERENTKAEAERRRKQTLNAEGLELWASLVSWMRAAVARINVTPVLGGRIGGTLEFRESSSNTFEVRVESVNGRIIIVARNGLSLHFRGKNLRVGDESLPFDLDESGDLFLRTTKGEALYREAIVEYLLRPFLDDE